MKISQAFNEYINMYLKIKGSHKNVIYYYATTSDYFCEIVGDKQLKDIDYDDISLFLTNIRTHRGTKRSVNTSISYIICLRNVIKYWHAREETKLNYQLIPLPKREVRVPSFLTADEVSDMIKACDSVRDKAIISILYGSGLRISELSSLNRDIIRFDSYSVIGKGSKARVCFLDVRTKKYLSKYLESRTDDSQALIVSKLGKRMCNQGIRDIVEYSAVKAGITKKVTPHTLRHSFATNYMLNDGNLLSLSSMLGHSSIQSTTIYTHITNRDLRREYMRHHTC